MPAVDNGLGVRVPFRFRWRKLPDEVEGARLGRSLKEAAGEASIRVTTIAFEAAAFERA